MISQSSTANALPFAVSDHGVYWRSGNGEQKQLDGMWPFNSAGETNTCGVAVSVIQIKRLHTHRERAVRSDQQNDRGFSGGKLQLTIVYHLQCCSLPNLPSLQDTAISEYPVCKASYSSGDGRTRLSPIPKHQLCYALQQVDPCKTLTQIGNRAQASAHLRLLDGPTGWKVCLLAKDRVAPSTGSIMESSPGTSA